MSAASHDSQGGYHYFCGDPSPVKVRATIHGLHGRADTTTDTQAYARHVQLADVVHIPASFCSQRLPRPPEQATAKI
jgi:hypothetical protein